MLVTPGELLNKAYQKNYSIGAFDAAEYLSFEAIIDAAEVKKTPVIVMVANIWFPLIDVEKLAAAMLERIHRSPLPIALLLDHGTNYEDCLKSIRYGFSGIMFDGSALEPEENIAKTKELADIAHAAGLSIEGEIGHVAGNEGERTFTPNEADTSLYTNPQDALDFVQKTGVDALAVAFGNVHGVYKGSPVLQFDLLDEIKKTVNVPLVMHGGSGLVTEDYIQSVRHGINKVNFFTAVSKVGTEAVIEKYNQTSGNVHYFELAEAGKKEMQKMVEGYIDMMGGK